MALLERWVGDYDSTSVDLLEVVGEALLRSERIDEAIRALEAGIRRFPSNQSFWANLGYVLAARKEQLDRAVDVLRRGLERMPSSLWIRNNLAYAYLKGGRYADARGVLESTEPATRSPERTSVFVCLLATWGLLLIREGSFDAGRAMYQRALELAPRGPLKERVRQKIVIEEAIEQISKRKPDEARRFLQKAIELDADPEFTDEARRLIGSTLLN